MRPYIATNTGQIIFIDAILALEPYDHGYKGCRINIGTSYVGTEHTVSEIIEMIQQATHTKEFNNKFEELISS